MITWEKSKKGYSTIHYESDNKLLDIWEYTSSDNLSIWNVYRWTVQLKGGEYLSSGNESTLDKACEAAMKAAGI